MSGAETPTRRTVVAAAAGALSVSRSAWATTSDPILHTHLGPVRGILSNGINQFLGVRYGADTARTRFRPPAEPAPWREVLDAVNLGAPCLQAGRTAPGEPDASEDCLHLNAWTPGLADEGRRPILVYIHGGAYASGSGGDPQTEGARLAAAGDVVVITVNHRLNVFGYLYLDRAFSHGFAGSGNVGQLDLILALRWVQRNASALGGDPNRIAVFGQSGGGAKIATLMATPMATGLFHAAMTMSGQQVTASGPLNAHRRTLAFAAAVGVRDVAQLVDLPSAALLEGLGARDPINPEHGMYFGPVLDDVVLHRHPFWPDAPPQSAGIPMVLGNTRDETRTLIGGREPEAFAVTWDELPHWLARHMRVDINPDRVLATYRQLYPQAGPSDVLFAATTAARSWRGQVEEADARARQGAPTWVYRFDHPSPIDGGRWGASHTHDIAYAFGTLGALGSRATPDAVSREVSSALQQALLSLARHGHPGSPGGVPWPHYSLPDRQTLIFDAAVRSENDPRGTERAMFATVPFTQWGT